MKYLKGFLILSVIMIYPAICQGKASLALAVDDDRDGYAYKLEISEQFKKVFDITLKRTYERDKGEIDKNSGSIALGYDPMLTENIGFWSDVKKAFNRPELVKHESFIGAGLKYYLFKTDISKLSISFGILHQRTQTTDLNILEITRTSTRLMYKYDERFGAVVFYKPNIHGAEDYIAEGYIFYRYDKNFSVVYEKEYRPAEGFEDGGLWLMYTKK